MLAPEASATTELVNIDDIVETLSHVAGTCMIVEATSLHEELNIPLGQGFPESLQVCFFKLADEPCEALRPGGCESACVQYFYDSEGKKGLCLKIQELRRIGQFEDWCNPTGELKQLLCCGGLLPATILRLCAHKVLELN